MRSVWNAYVDSVKQM